MKNLCCLLVLVGLFACSDKTQQNGLEYLNLSESNDVMIRQIVHNFDSIFLMVQSRSGHIQYPELYSAIKESKKKILLPLYVINEDVFYEDPSSEKLVSCFYQPENEKWFMGIGNDTILFTTVKINDIWQIGKFINNWNRVVDWVHSKLKEVGTTDYKIIKLEERTFIHVIEYGKPVFYNLRGTHKMTADKFCEYVIECINNKRSNLKHVSPQKSVEGRKEKLDSMFTLLSGSSRVGELYFNHGYYYGTMYPFPVKNQQYNGWCSFAAIASHPKLENNLSVCSVATNFVNKYVGGPVDCCDLEEEENYLKCIHNQLPTFQKVIFDFAKDYSIPGNRLEDIVDFFIRVLKQPVNITEYPFLMFFSTDNPGHVALFCGAQILASTQINYIILVCADPDGGVVVQRQYGYSELCYTHIEFMV